MREFDAVVVGSGINSLVCGAMLAKNGWKVCLLERSSYFGGAIRTAEITRPGFLHELYSAWYPLFTAGGAYQALKPDLDARGITFLTAPLTSATLYPDGTSAFIGLDGAANAAELERLAPGDGEAWGRFLGEIGPNLDLIFGFLGADLSSPRGRQILQAAEDRLGHDGLLALSGSMLGSCRDWLTQTFQSPRSHGLFAPWITHAGLGPESALSSMMMQVFAVTLQFVGMPVVKGGGSRLVEALLEIIRTGGGECRTSADVDRVLVEGGQARGVRLAGGEEISAGKAVVASVTPTQLYQRLLSESEVPAPRLAAARKFRYGPACMQIQYALSQAPQWEGDPRLAQVPAINITAGLDGVSRAWNEGVRGLLPAEPALFVGQPTAVDPSRAPDGGAILMVQLLGLPNYPTGDAAGTIPMGEGGWNPAVVEKFADRVTRQLQRHIPNLPSILLDRVVVSPRDLEAVNINLVNGDPYGGSLEIAQHYLWRPMPGYPKHETHISGLYQIGASTYPGHGLGGGSGLLVAQSLLG